MLQYLVLVGAAFSLYSCFSYIQDIRHGTTRPNRVSWLLWSIAPLIGTVAALASGVTWAALPVFMSGFGPLLVFLYSLGNRNSYWQLGLFDYLCGACSLLALVLWGVTRHPEVAILLAIVSDALALLPTLVKAWREPKTESALAYFAGVCSALTSFAAVSAWEFAQIGFPIYLIISNSSVLLALYRRRLVG
jgi:hypothetical protein